MQSTPLITDLELSGTLQALQKAELSVAAEALVKTIHVDVGTNVKRGDLLLELDDSIARQEHQRAQAQLSAAQTTFSESQRLQDEALKLKPQNHIAQSEVDARISATNLAKARMEEARADARLAAEQLAKHKLHAPFDGVISARWTELGQWASQGDPVFTLVSMNVLRLDVKLPQEHLANIDRIDAINIRPDTQPALQISAKIDALVPVGDESRSILLRLTANETSPALFPGASARAQFRFKHDKNAVLVPRDAILRNADGNYSVFIVENNKAHRRQIVLGISGREGYLIESGLQPGEQIVTRGNELLSEGQAVTVTNPASPSGNSQE